MTRQPSIAAIDLSGIFRRYWHAGEHEDIGMAYRKTIEHVHGIAAGHDLVAVCVDRPPYNRRKLDPQYKAHRDKAPEVMHEQLRATIDALSNDGLHILGAEGYEADDVIATVCRWAFGRSPMVEVMVYSSDKDLMQLIGPTITMVSTATGETYDAAKVREKFGIEPARIPDALALMGDKADGVPGITGVGPVKAAEWLKEHGSLDGIIAAADKLPEKFRKVVADCADRLRLNLRLTKLAYDVPCNPEVILTEKPRTKTENEPPTPDQVPDEPEAAPEPVKTTAMAVHQPQAVGEPVPWERQLEPKNSAQAWGLAGVIYKSRLFGDFPNPEAIMSVIMTGRSFGLDAVTSMRSFHAIKGKACPTAQFLIGQCKKHPSCEYFRLVESTPDVATWETKRRDEPEPTRMSYTLKQADMAGLLKVREGKEPNQWHKRPDTMLRWRAGTELARAVYPDVCGGLYSVEEMEEG